MVSKDKLTIIGLQQEFTDARASFPALPKIDQGYWRMSERQVESSFGAIIDGSYIWLLHHRKVPSKYRYHILSLNL
jgi:hypothetical protein